VSEAPGGPRPALRAFRRPWLWVAGWAFGWLLCIVLSLVRPPDLGMDVPDGDKLGHLVAYTLLSAWSVWLFATRRARWAAALALVALGLALEWAQGHLTAHRMMDPRDGVANTLGVLLGQCAAFVGGGRFLQRLDARLPARRG
jgi:VanZ family protein